MHLKTLHNALGGGVSDIAADDLVFIHQHSGIDRSGAAGVVVDLVDVTHDGLSGVFAQVISLSFLQIVVPVKGFTGSFRDPDPTGFCGGCGHIPSEVCQKFDPSVIGRGGGCGGLGGVISTQQQNQRKKEQKAHERNKKFGKRRTKA